MASTQERRLRGDHRVIYAGFLCALGILAAIAAFSYTRIASFTERETQVARSHEILQRIDGVLTLLLDAETGARGYLLTSRRTFLIPYLTAKNHLPAAVRALGTILVLQGAARQRFREIEALVTRRLQTLHAQLFLKRRGAERPQIVAEVREGKRIADTIRRTLSLMRAHQRALLARRAKESSIIANQAIVVIALGNLASFSLLIVGFVVLRRENALRARAECELLSANETLEGRIQTRTAELANSNQRLSHEIEEHKRARDEIAAINASLEQQVAGRTELLEASNKELESFSYSVSHDLRAPLRAVDGFSRVLQEDYGAALDTEGHRVIEVIRENSQRMARLIDDLLAFSRLGRSQMSVAEIDMEALAREAAEEVEQAAHARLSIQPMPRVGGDRALFKQVWINLLSNAFKFSSKAAAPAVEVGGLAEAGQHVYYVADNGVGFDMRYYDKLFGVFQRLHRADDFPGTGVGLAIVQRVLARHGGRVWAESEPGHGATFYIAVPQGADGEA